MLEWRYATMRQGRLSAHTSFHPSKFVQYIGKGSCWFNDASMLDGFDGPLQVHHCILEYIRTLYRRHHSPESLDIVDDSKSTCLDSNVSRITRERESRSQQGWCGGNLDK